MSNFYITQRAMTATETLASFRRLHAAELAVKEAQTARLLVRKPLPPTILREAEFNTGNHYDYTPYITTTEGAVVIDQVWFSSLSSYIQDLIRQRLNFRFGKVNLPHPPQKDDPLLRIVYQSVWDGFDYNIWYSPSIPGGAKGMKMLLIDDSVKKLLLTQQPLPDSFVTDIEKLIEEKTAYFVRLSSTSGKNYTPIRPYTAAKEIVSLLTTCKIYVDKEYSRPKPTHLILLPWNDGIDARNEFRIFVVNRRVTAASPQRWGEIHNYTQEELDDFQQVLSEADFIEHVPHQSFVADVYIVNQKCHLIELNAFGAHSGVSSSLFNWIDDYDLLHGNISRGEFRYLSVINI